jgi:polyhydroxyalkanoate synthesis repressor PhaR
MATILIKKYSNRKLYDQTHSRYVTLDEIADLIRQGGDVAVVDATSGEDLTSVTLAQVILENERNRKTAFPAAFLHQLIKNGESVQAFFQKTMATGLDSLVTSQREASRAMKEWGERAGFTPPGAGGATPAGEPRQAGGSAEAKAKGDDQALRSELEALKERIRQLEQRLGRSE